MDLDTGQHRHGEMGPVTVASDGSRVAYRRAGRICLLDVPAGVERVVVDEPVDGYATDAACRVVAYTVDGRLYRKDADGGAAERLDVPGPVYDARPDPSGRRLAYLTAGTLRVIDEHGADQLLAGERADSGQPADVRWGEPRGAEVFGMHRGYWWSPDGERLLATRVDRGTTAPGTSLHLLDLDGFWVDVRWDRQAYPHLAAVTWEPRGGPLVTVLPRSQHHALVLAVDARTGETQVHAELDDPRWVDVTPGTPAYLPDGRVVLGGELTLDATDTRCLFADGTLLTPSHLQVRRLCARLPGPADAEASRTGPGSHLVDLIVEAGEGEPSEQHVYRVRLAARSGSPEVTRLTTDAGWHSGYAAGGTVVIASESLDHPGVRLTVHHTDGVRQISAEPSDTPARGGPAPRDDQGPPRPVLGRVTDRRLPYGVLYPTDHVAGRRLPVLVDVVGVPGAGPGVTATRAGWRRRQSYADRGVAVVVVDGRGTPGTAPSFEKAIYRRVLDIMLADQTEALAALAAKHPDLDLERVVIRGAGLAGAVALAAVLRHPESFRGAVAYAPVTDWSLLPLGFAERYLGSRQDNPETYARHDLTAEVPELRRPVLLVCPPDGGPARHAAPLAAAAPAGLLELAASAGSEPGFVRRVLEAGV